MLFGSEVPNSPEIFFPVWGPRYNLAYASLSRDLKQYSPATGQLVVCVVWHIPPTKPACFANANPGVRHNQDMVD